MTHFFSIFFKREILFCGNEYFRTSFCHISILIFTLSFAGCASIHKTSESPISQEKMAPSYSKNINSDSDESKITSPQKERVIVRTARQTIEAHDVFLSVSKLTALINQSKGYVEDSYQDHNSGATIRARVPSEKLDSTLNEISQLGREIERIITAKDVTIEKIDLEARIKNLMVLRDRFRNLVAQGKDIKDVVSLEEELNRIQTELDSLQSKLEQLKSEVAMSSIAITIKPEKILGPLGYVGYGLYWFVEKLFVIR